MPEKKIYPLAYELKPNTIRTLYYQGFPIRWKTELLEIFRAVKPNMNDEYGLPTKPLETMLLAWMDGVVKMTPLKKSSCDEKWLTSCIAYDDKSLQTLCKFIEIWCRTTFSRAKYKAMPVSAEKAVLEFCSSMQWEELKNLQTQTDVTLTFEDGTVSGEAYDAIPLLAVNKLLGKTLELHGTDLHLYYSGKKELISQPLEDSKSHNQYSFVFDFSVQTTPPKRSALLLCHMSIRRWIHDSWRTNGNIYPDDKIQAHVQTGDNKFSQMSICGNYRNRSTVWNAEDEQCYNICNYEQLSSAQDVVNTPSLYAPRILLPYRSGMKGFCESKIGTGISVLDKAVLHIEILKILNDIVSDHVPEALWLGKRSGIPTLKSPALYENPEKFREWVRSCTETDEIVFELYGIWDDSIQKDLLIQIHNKIANDFGENANNSCMKIHIVHKEIRDMVNNLSSNDMQTNIRHSRYVEKSLGPANLVTACIVVIQSAEDYSTGDPKQSVRNGFAMTGRLVQFINPPKNETEISTAKIEHCVYDLYRQLGIVTLIDFSGKKKNPLLSVPCIGLHICSQIHNKMKKARYLPLTVQVDLQTGRTRVSCDAFRKHTLSYRDACLEMAQLFWRDDLEKVCTQASYQPAKQLLLKMKNEYRTTADNSMLLINSDGNTRSLWNGISDKEIGEYDVEQEYCPKSINTGKKSSPFSMKLLGTGIRIVRVRTNHEVPDYYTGFSSANIKDEIKRASTSGVFRYRDTYWSIAQRDNDKRYISSCKESRIDHPTQDYAEKDMSEIYPLQLQCEDKTSDWVFFADALCAISLQYSMSTVLPLPLHLAKRLEEYLFDI